MTCLTLDYNYKQTKPPEGSMEVKKVPLAKLKLYRNNPRKGNIDLIAESLERYGQYKPITANADGEILTGNHTYQAAQKLGWAEINVVYIDVDDVTAAKIVTMDNRTTDTGAYDNERLAKLLEDLPELEGTGYTFEEYDSLLAEINEATMPVLTDQTQFTSVNVGETGQSGTLYVPSLADYADRYAQKATRMLLLDFDNDIYVWLVDKLIEYRAIHNITSNSEALLKLVEDAVGEKRPENVG
jgi:hypothetical protein